MDKKRGKKKPQQAMKSSKQLVSKFDEKRDVERVGGHRHLRCQVALIDGRDQLFVVKVSSSSDSCISRLDLILIFCIRALLFAHASNIITS